MSKASLGIVTCELSRCDTWNVRTSGSVSSFRICVNHLIVNDRYLRVKFPR